MKKAVISHCPPEIIQRQAQGYVSGKSFTASEGHLCMLLSQLRIEQVIHHILRRLVGKYMLEVSRDAILGTEKRSRVATGC